MSCWSLMVQTQLAYPTHQKYNFPQLCVCCFLLFIKRFKKSFPSREAVLDFQSTGLLRIAGEYFPAMSEKCTCHTNGWCKENCFLRFLLQFMSLDFHSVAEGLTASSYSWVQSILCIALLTAFCLQIIVPFLISAKVRILGVLHSSEAVTFWPEGLWSARQISDHCAVFPLTFHCQSTSRCHSSQHISCQK